MAGADEVRGYALFGNVIDGSGGPPESDGVVVTSGERIAWVGTRSELSPEYSTAPYVQVDLPGRSICPGLVDAHTHISFGEAQSEEQLAFTTPVEYRSIKAAWNAGKVLRAGVTSASDAASTFNVAVAVRDAISAGMVTGPRMAVAGRQLTTHQGLEDAFPSWVEFPVGQAGVLVRNIDEIIEMIRLEVKDGVDIIKVSGSDDSMVTGDQVDGMAFNLAEFRAISEETHRLGRKCTVHARTADAARAAAASDFDWIQHASYIDAEGIELAAERNIPIVPVLTLLDNFIASAGDQRSSTFDAIKRELDAAVANLQLARAAGIKLLAGSESGWSLVPYGEWHAKELELFVNYLGMSPLEAISAGTRDAAMTVPAFADDIGLLEPGRLADVIVLPGDPSKDIRLLQHKERFDYVFKGGQSVPLEPVADIPLRSFERTKVYLAGKFMFDSATGTGVAVQA